MYSTDPSIGARTGFGGVILHGLSTYGFAARHLVSAIGGNDPSSLKYFSARFTSPVRPGDELETRAWELGGLGGGHGAFSSFVICDDDVLKVMGVRTCRRDADFFALCACDC